MDQAAQQRRNADLRSRGENVESNHVPTGFNAIDSKFGGVRLGVVTEIMGHTGDGKSALLKQIGEGAARAGHGVLWFVAEDPRDATADRIISGLTGIETTVLGKYDVDSAQLRDIDLAVAKAQEWSARILPVFDAQDVDSVLSVIDDTETVGGAPLGLVIIDYVQILGTSRNLEDDIARLGEELHKRARVTDSNHRRLAIIAASQVATDVIRRGRDAWFNNRDITRIRPSLGDTEWCRRLEKLTKAIWVIVRPNRWLREFGEDVDDDNAELHIIKANFGPMGWAELGWDGPTARFINK